MAIELKVGQRWLYTGALTSISLTIRGLSEDVAEYETLRHGSLLERHTIPRSDLECSLAENEWALVIEVPSTVATTYNAKCFHCGGPAIALFISHTCYGTCKKES